MASFAWGDRARMFARIFVRSIAIAAALACISSAALAAGPQPPKHAPGMPNVIQVSPCIPTMGYHYADPKTLPFGPIYGWYDGKWVFTEIMVNAQQLGSMHQSWDDQLKPLPGYSINHVDFWFEKYGHPGYWVPHYDIHAFYVPHSDHMFWCGNTSGKRMQFKQGPHGQMIMTPMQ
jgi:hypothetical protein